MSRKFQPGDTVRVDFETTVSSYHDSLRESKGRVSIVQVNGDSAQVPLESVALVPPAVPTNIGAVIKITQWDTWTDSLPWTALLTVAGWRVSVDRSITYSVAEFNRKATEGTLRFETIWEGNNG
jgi:hypothetical protein